MELSKTDKLHQSILRANQQFMKVPVVSILMPVFNTAPYLGEAIESILSQIDRVAEDYNGRVKTGQRMQQMIDGYGADRIVAEIMRLR